MSWELSEFTLEETSGPVQVFNFEAKLEGMGPSAHPANDGDALGGAQGRPPSSEFVFRGDGIYMSRTRQLRLNRETELAAAIRERFAPPLPPYAPKGKVAHFDATPLVNELKQVLQARVSAPPLVARRPELTSAMPTPAVGSVAYMLRWEH